MAMGSDSHPCMFFGGGDSVCWLFVKKGAGAMMPAVCLRVGSAVY